MLSCCSGDTELASETGDGEDPQDSGFITRMFDKVATSALGPSSLPTKVTPHHFQVGPLLPVWPAAHMFVPRGQPHADVLVCTGRLLLNCLLFRTSREACANPELPFTHD